MSWTVLVVDDIAANRSLLGATLEPKGHEVLLAPNVLNHLINGLYCTP